MLSKYDLPLVKAEMERADCIVLCCIVLHCIALHCIVLQESYAMLSKYDLPLVKDEMERVDTLRYSWQKMAVLGSEISSQLVTIQPQFRKKLIRNVKTFVHDASDFYASYDQVGQIY